MGKGDKRRPIDESKVAANWPFERPKLNGGRTSYIWCPECRVTHDAQDWCGHALKKTEKTRTYGFALMPDLDPRVARLLQHDQLDFATTTIEKSAEKMRKDYVERTSGIA